MIGEDINGRKKYYTMYLSAEEEAYGNVLLTPKEACIVKSALEEMSENLSGGGYCGSCSIDIENPRKDRFDFGEDEDEEN